MLSHQRTLTVSLGEVAQQTLLLAREAAVIHDREVRAQKLRQWLEGKKAAELRQAFKERNRRRVR